MGAAEIFLVLCGQFPSPTQCERFFHESSLWQASKACVILAVDDFGAHRPPADQRRNGRRRRGCNTAAIFGWCRTHFPVRRASRKGVNDDSPRCFGDSGARQLAKAACCKSRPKLYLMSIPHLAPGGQENIDPITHQCPAPISSDIATIRKCVDPQPIYETSHTTAPSSASPNVKLDLARSFFSTCGFLKGCLRAHWALRSQSIAAGRADDLPARLTIGEIAIFQASRRVAGPGQRK